MTVLNLIFMFSGALILAGGYFLCYYSYISKAKVRKQPKQVEHRPAFKLPDNRNQLANTAEVKHRILRPNKIEE
jgi:hypothetical protein